MGGVQFRFTQSARKHRIGKAHVREAIANAGEPTRIPATDGQVEDRLSWIGVDDRGAELEILGVETPDYVLIIHVMPTALRRRDARL